MQRGVAALEEVEAERRRQRGHRDQRFGGAEPDERPRDPIRRAPADDAPQGQARHEDRPDRAGGVDGDAEHQPDQPQPEHLIDQRAGAGEEEKSGEEDQQGCLYRAEVKRGSMSTGTAVEPVEHRLAPAAGRRRASSIIAFAFA